MKLLKPIVFLTGIVSMGMLQANTGLDAYRLGQYEQAAVELHDKTDKNGMRDYYIARMQLYGYGLLKNNEKALDNIRKAAGAGYTPAQEFMARYALTIEKSPKDAFNWFKKLADKGSLSAKIYVIGAYKYGYGVRKNPRLANRIYIQGAKDGYAIPQYILAREFLSSRHQRNHNLGLIWLRRSAAQGYSRAQTFLAEMYISGDKVSKDKSKGIALLSEAAENGYTPAMRKLAKLADENKEYEVAKIWWEKAAEAGDSKAMLVLAALHLDTDSRYYQAETGFNWTRRAAELPSETARKFLAELYEKGQGIAVDKDKAKEWKRKAEATVKNGKTKRAERQMAQFISNDKTYNLARTDYYLKGILTSWENPATQVQAQYNAFPEMEGVKAGEIIQPRFELVQPNEISFISYFDQIAPELSANARREWRYPRYSIDTQIQKLMNNEMLIYPHSDWHSMVEEGCPYPDAPNGQEWNYIEELLTGWRQRVNLYLVVNRLYNQAILGNSDAQFEIGQLYHYGIGVGKNPEQARIYYKLAAEQDDVRAEYNLGMLFMQGQIEPPDYEKGMNWLEDAAFRGNAYAQYALANIYQYGYVNTLGELVVEPDESRAMSMYYLASANRFGLAQYKLANGLVVRKDQGLSVEARKNRIKIIKKLYHGAADAGVADALLPLAFYQAMDASPEKQAQAFDIARQEAENGHAQAPLLLGLLYEHGIGTKSDPVKALYWYQQGEDSPLKAFILGTYYSLGKEVNQDLNRARTLLSQSADAGFSYANLNLAVLNQQGNRPFLFDLIRARDEGNAQAALLLADYYLSQNDTENVAQVRTIYEKLAENGDRDAQLKLGYLHAQGRGVDINYKEAAAWLHKSAEQGQPMAQFLLAQMYQLGQVDKTPDIKGAIRWYEAASTSMPRAALALGFVYDTAEDNYGQAMRAYQMAANHGHPLGQYNLGLLFEYGKGMPVDMAKAREWYGLAAEQEQPQATTRLGVLNFNGEGGDKNASAALGLFSKAAEAGDRDALYQLGLLAETGIARKLDLKDAIQYYEKAAEKGNVKASLALGRIYQFGLGGFKDPAKARAIYNKLAKNGNSMAQYQLAVMDIRADLDENGWSEVKSLLKQAQSNGNRQAEVLLHKIDAIQNNKTSFIEPVLINLNSIACSTAVERCYHDALNVWSQGDVRMSRMMLQRLLENHPRYAPARGLYKHT